jgi:hypothetical protein
MTNAAMTGSGLPETCPREGTCAKGWGLFPADGTRYHWSARAILDNDGGIDLLHDRMAVEGEASDDERKALGAWLDGKALPYLRAKFATCDDTPYQSECREITVKGDGFTLRADPRASYGYLYLSATVDPTATDPTPSYLARPVNDAKTPCKACKAYSGSRHVEGCSSAKRVAARQAREGGPRDPDRKVKRARSKPWPGF